MSIVNQLDVMYYDRSLWIKYFDRLFCNKVAVFMQFSATMETHMA